MSARRPPPRRLVLALALLPSVALAEEPPAAPEPVEEPSLGTTVRSRRPRREVGAFELGVEEAAHAPGALGDPLVGAATLPGTGRANGGGDQLVLWGAEPAHARALFEEVPLPRLLHLGGMRSTVAPSLVGGMELSPGAPDAAHGRAIGGTLRIGSAPAPSEAGLHGDLTLDALTLGGAVRWADEPGGMEVRSAARLGWLGAALRKASPSLGLQSPLGDSWDHGLRTWLPLPAGGEAELFLLQFGDRRTRAFTAVSGSQTEALRHHLLGARARFAGSDGLDTTVVGWLGLGSESLSLDEAGAPAHLQRDQLAGGLRARRPVVESAVFALQLGSDLEARTGRWDREGTLSTPRREGSPAPFGLPPGEVRSRDSWRSSQLSLALFTEGELRLPGAVRIVAGLRFEPTVVDGDRLLPPAGGSVPVGFTRGELWLDPRLAVSWRPTPALELTVGAGRSHQLPSGDDLSPVFGNPTLGGLSAWQATAEARLRLGEATVGWSAWGRWSDGIATPADALCPAGSSCPALGAALLAQGTETSRGSQLTVRLARRSWLSGWASYTLARTTRIDAPGLAARPSDFDQTHSLLVAASARPWERWEFGARLRVSSGNPTTAVVGTAFDATRGSPVALLGTTNGDRLPTWFQLDLSAERRFTLPVGELAIRAEVLNATHRSNTEAWLWAADFRSRAPQPGLPLLAFVGGQFAW